MASPSGSTTEGELLEFYDSVLSEIERMIAQPNHDDTIKRKLRKQIEEAKITGLMKLRLTPEQIKAKAKKILNILRQIKANDITALQPPPTKAKSRKGTVCKLSSDRLQLDIGSTIKASQHIKFDTDGQAIPLCLPNDMDWDEAMSKCTKTKKHRNSLHVIPQAMRIIESIEGPIAVIAIVGPCRTGKSYILSKIINSTGAKCHFSLGHKMDPETMGIWMWSRPFKIILRSGEQATLILLDTEGIDAANADDRSDNQIFTLSVLLSSLLIYNSTTVPRREDLKQMDFVANLSKSIRMQAEVNAGKVDENDISSINPKFMWVLRDAILEPTDRNNKSCHFRDYLIQKILVADKRADEVHQEVCRCLLGFFKSFDAETIPPPSSDPHVMRKIEDPQYERDLNPRFVEQVEYVRKRILSICPTKSGYTPGSKVNGYQLSQMVKIYVETLNDPNGVPTIGSTWQRVIQATYEGAIKSAFALYSAAMQTAMGGAPMEEEILLQCHEEAREQCLSKFNADTSLDTESILYQKYLHELMVQVAIYSERGVCTGGSLHNHLLRNQALSETLCRDVYVSLKNKHIKHFVDSLSNSTNYKQLEYTDLERACVKVAEEYWEKAVGPGANEIWRKMLKEQEHERQRLGAQLKLLKNYDEEAERKSKALREQDAMLHRTQEKERELAKQFEQSKRDQMAKIAALTNKFEQDKRTMEGNAKRVHNEHLQRMENMADANLKQLQNDYEAERIKRKNEFDTHLVNMQLKNNEMQQELDRLRALQDNSKRSSSTSSSGSSSGGGCFAPGTQITISNGCTISIEKQAEGIKVLAVGGVMITITCEFVESPYPAESQLFGINNDEPFAALNHPFLTAEGWKCLDPDLANEENENNFKMLRIGDIVFKIAKTNPLIYQPVIIERFTYQTMTEQTSIYGLHLDGCQSYHANGYAVYANYPVLTKVRFQEGIKKLNDQEQKKFTHAITSVKSEFNKVMGKWVGLALGSGSAMREIDEDTFNCCSLDD